MSQPTISSHRHQGQHAPAGQAVAAPFKACVSPVRLYSELYQIAGGPHGKGAATLYRVRAICQQLHENHPDLELLEQLRSLQELMVDWTSERGWKLHGNGSGPAALREQLMDCIDEISGLAEPDGLIPAAVPGLPRGNASAASGTPFGAGGL